MPKSCLRREGRISWSIVSKAAERSKSKRNENFVIIIGSEKIVEYAEKSVLEDKAEIVDSSSKLNILSCVSCERSGR